LLLAITALPVLALIGIFGQRTDTTSVNGGAATLELSGPSRIRGGLYLQTRITVRAHQQLSKPTLVLDRGFLNGLTVNTIEPQASQELNRNGSLVLQYNGIQAGNRLTVWVEYQVNPTTVGGRTQTLELDDGDTKVATIARHFTSFP
jgi:hypothetical protein